jgi:putative Mn2+ efflux pump MntP
MSFMELVLIAVGLSMDAFAVAICKGLSVQKLGWKHYLTVGVWFGGFQALMPTLGYLLGTTFERYITSVDHWVAFVLLCLIGGSMLKEGLAKEEEEKEERAGFDFKSMLLLAVATSIDALAVGITFALLPDVNIFSAVGLIGTITFCLSAVGLKVGNIFGLKYKSKAEVVGGVILILIGVKILLEHLGVVDF